LAGVLHAQDIAQLTAFGELVADAAVERGDLRPSVRQGECAAAVAEL
jgi:hypothetical protein